MKEYQPSAKALTSDSTRWAYLAIALCLARTPLALYLVLRTVFRLKPSEERPGKEGKPPTAEIKGMRPSQKADMLVVKTCIVDVVLLGWEWVKERRAQNVQGGRWISEPAGRQWTVLK